MIFDDNLRISIPCPNLLLNSVPFSIQRKKFINNETISCCNKIYHRDFLEGKYFPDYIKEDVYFHIWTMREARRVAERRDTNYYYSPHEEGRNQSYYSRPNGDFYDLVESYEWTRRKIGNDEEVLNILAKKQVAAFKEYLYYIIDWNISEHQKESLIGTILEYCHLKYHMDISEISKSAVRRYYEIYKTNKKTQEETPEYLEKRLMIQSHQYPRRRK